jgi:hypothetical protein
MKCTASNSYYLPPRTTLASSVNTSGVGKSTSPDWDFTLLRRMGEPADYVFQDCILLLYVL